MQTNTQRLTTLAKADAKKIVSKKFGKLGVLTTLASLIISLPMFIILIMNMAEVITSSLTSDISGVSMSLISLVVILFLIVAPITFGQIKCFYDTYKTGDFQWKTLFIAFETLDSYKRAVKYAVLMFSKLALWLIPISAAVYFMAMQIVYLIFMYIAYGDFVAASQIAFMAAIVIALILILVTVLVQAFKYCAGYLTLIDNPEIGCKGALRQGVQTFKGYNTEIIYFLVSFILWQIFSALTYGVAAFFTVPYIALSFITLVRKIEDDKSRKVQEELERIENLGRLESLENIMIIEDTSNENLDNLENELNTVLTNASNMQDEDLDIINQKLGNKEDL